MSTPIPMPLRAAAGLAAVAVDEARRLPSRLVNLPVLAVGTALSVSLKAQQRYAELVVRGDQILGQLRGQQAGTPPWVRFDDEEPGLADPADDHLAEAMAVAVDEDVVDGAGPLDAGTLDADPLDADPFDAGPVPASPDVLTVGDVDGTGELLEALPDGDAGAPGSAEEEIGSLTDDASRYDGYLSEPPLRGYDEMSIPQLRARLRTLTERQLTELVGYERATTQRPAYLTMLENRLNTVRGR